MSVENLLWGAAAAFRRMLKLGFEIAQSSVAKYNGQALWTVKPRLVDLSAKPRARHCRHGFFVARPSGSQAAVWLRHSYGFDRQDLVWINVTTNPTAEWVATSDHRGLSLDELHAMCSGIAIQIYGAVVTRRLRAMGIRDKPITPASLAEWLCRTAIGSIRRGVWITSCLRQEHLRRILKSLSRIITTASETHRSLHKDAPVSRPVQHPAS